MSYQVIFSREAAEDLERLFNHLLDRELSSPTGDLSIPARAIKAIKTRANSWPTARSVAEKRAPAPWCGN